MTTTTLTAPVPVPLPRFARTRRALCAAGRAVVDGLATDNGWCWAYGVWYPYMGPIAQSHAHDRQR